MYHNWFVVWNMNFMTCHSVGNVMIPADFHSMIFQRGLNHQPVMDDISIGTGIGTAMAIYMASAMGFNT